MTCTRCGATGILNIEQCPDKIQELTAEEILKWAAANQPNDVTVCDCCGDGAEFWHYHPGHHDTNDFHDPRGPYADNGGVPECI